MTEVIDRGIPRLAQEALLADVDVHEGLGSVRDLLPYPEEPWKSRVEAAEDFKGIDTLPYSSPQVAGVAMVDAATRGGASASSSHEQRMRDQLLDARNVEYAILASFLRPADVRTQPEFATALASAYKDWLLQSRSPQKACSQHIRRSNHTRCIGHSNK